MHKQSKYLIFSVTFLLFFSLSVLSAFAASETSFRYTSQVGNLIDGGKSGFFTKNNATFSITGNSGYLSLHILAAKGEGWSIDISAPTGEKLHPGKYLRAERPYLKTGRSPGFEVSSNGGICNEVWGNFDINQIATDKAGNITVLDANFSQSCDSPNSPKFSGVVKYNAKPLGFSIKSDPGDYIGGGATKQYTNATSIFSLIGNKTSVTFTASGNRDNWFAIIGAPISKGLKVGTYKTTKVADDTRAALDFSENIRICVQSTGTLVIKAISYKANGNIASLNASFEQHCEGRTAALRGNIRYFE